ncbi:hypothetical protein KBC75_04885 [Candidatus Shapirobacteria bacterium]|nr:hypothetical protein [Candidatus Shapirobacteria bacterium]
MIEEKINKLEEIVVNLEKKLEKRRLDMGDQDNSNVSRYITATRWAVEQEIEALDKELVRLKNGIRELVKLKDDKNRTDGNFFVADEFEYIELGIISTKTKKGQEILGMVK